MTPNDDKVLADTVAYIGEGCPPFEALLKALGYRVEILSNNTMETTKNEMPEMQVSPNPNEGFPREGGLPVEKKIMRFVRDEVDDLRDHLDGNGEGDPAGNTAGPDARIPGPLLRRGRAKGRREARQAAQRDDARREYTAVGCVHLWLEVLKGGSTKEIREDSRAMARDLLRASLQMP